MPQVVRQLAFADILQEENPDSAIAIDLDFPESFANRLSHYEAYNKHLFRPNTYLHKWWARRCGSTFRLILKQFVSDTERRDYYASGGLEGKTVLDPMMGGGTTLHEAIRLGANVIGVDVDPIPVIQARASLTSVSWIELQDAFNRFFDHLYQHLSWYFQTECPECNLTVDSQFTLHGLRRRCACGEVVMVEQYELRQEQEGTIRLCPDTWEIVRDHCMDGQATSPNRLLTKGQTVCPQCGQKYADLLDVPLYARYLPLVIAGSCPQHGAFFRKPGPADLERIEAAGANRQKLDFDPISHFAIQDGPKSGDLLARNVRSYLDVFSSRQLLYLYHSIQLIESFSGAIKLNLALLVSTSLEFNAMLCGYKGWFRNRPGAIRHVFGLHAYAFQYTAAENNPVNRTKSSGNLKQLFRDRIERGRRWAIAPIERRIDENGSIQQVKIPGEVDGGVEVFDLEGLQRQRQAFWLLHQDARHLPLPDASVDFIVTDPPYFDSVQYSDLAVFFRVWLERLAPGEIDWIYDESSSAVANSTVNGDRRYVTVLGGIFQECARVLKPVTGRMVFTYHHWDPNAWADLTIALKQAGFRLLNVHVVFSENPISSHILNLKALKHDAILALGIEDQHPSPCWESTDAITATDSETFCRECGVALGWLLASDLDAQAIRAHWAQLLQGRK